jgi:hypothetical protein
MLMLAGASMAWAADHAVHHGDDRSRSATTQPSAKAAKYVCPMGCAGSESDKPGKCPKCGMDLVRNSTDDAGKGSAEQQHHNMH